MSGHFRKGLHSTRLLDNDFERLQWSFRVNCVSPSIRIEMGHRCHATNRSMTSASFYSKWLQRQEMKPNFCISWPRERYFFFKSEYSFPNLIRKHLVSLILRAGWLPLRRSDGSLIRLNGNRGVWSRSNFEVDKKKVQVFLFALTFFVISPVEGIIYTILRAFKVQQLSFLQYMLSNTRSCSLLNTQPSGCCRPL
jgi:hypothetical protein